MPATFADAPKRTLRPPHLRHRKFRTNFLVHLRNGRSDRTTTFLKPARLTENTSACPFCACIAEAAKTAISTTRP